MSRVSNQVIKYYLPEDTLKIVDFTIKGYHIDDSLSPGEYRKLITKADSIKYDTSINYVNSETEIHFRKSVLWFYYNTTRLSGFRLHDNYCGFVIKGVRIKVGDAVTSVKHLFPTAYAGKYPSGNDKDTLVVVNISDYSGILFNISFNRIKSIEYWFDND